MLLVARFRAKKRSRPFPGERLPRGRSRADFGPVGRFKVNRCPKKRKNSKRALRAVWNEDVARHLAMPERHFKERPVLSVSGVGEAVPP